MQENIPVRWQLLIEALCARLGASSFCARHRRQDRDFTRQRRLSFSVLLLLLLQKSTKSVQRRLQSFFQQLLPAAVELSVTGGAWTQARAKLKATALIELNQEVLVPGFYAPEQAAHRRGWRGHRLLGVDGSMLRLPSHPSVRAVFGQVEVSNAYGQTGTVYSTGRMSILYDLLNRIGLDARLAPSDISEMALIIPQLAQVGKNDLVLWDRGLTSYLLLAHVLRRGADFLGRCARSGFASARQLFQQNEAGVSRIVLLSAPKNQRAELQHQGLALEMLVRLVTVRLPTGELEVLVTSLLDERRYPTHEFGEVYHWRWNHETYHLMLKSRLTLENWSGHTVEAIHQDLQAAVLVANLETLLSQEVQEKLTRGDAARKYPAQINHTVSYHALKMKIIDLLGNQKNVATAIREIQSWMQCNPVSVRTRLSPRRPPSAYRSLHYQRHLKKSTF